MKLPIYDQKGEEVGTTVLPKEVFDVSLNPDLVHQVVVSQMANRRQGSAHTKGRGEVRGGGRKPWRQKGTGRARAGSIRSPLWRGGGVTFGPSRDKVFKKKTNQKMRRRALLMVLSTKAKNNLLILLDNLKITESKTKAMAEILKKLPGQGKSTLIVLPGMDKNVILAARNLSGIGIRQAKDLNALDILQFKYLIMPKSAVKVIKETFLKTEGGSTSLK
ncbi:MAG: 50S ribosomal protein L4 [Candidatus Nealsonbacteria bacterium CG09_land_8_20_14_0_10_42_14]|uniref:Large ribosomal subunit protein uL4 n=1 Tax=Candidatus Nealsonbacteria bacterium CG09_land_8_20_14_0_10_42_14 TaxID=1974707 RepID=A0A2H0WXI4_9BACT|nr:MAG: 50S ribosomal protein L4 [Candidatus Nealsonbacteria bacterium CG09_land_8_20_14_0_10_42_14]